MRYRWYRIKQAWRWYWSCEPMITLADMDHIIEQVRLKQQPAPTTAAQREDGNEFSNQRRYQNEEDRQCD